jgi:ABC-2 type transport system permease protein
VTLRYYLGLYGTYFRLALKTLAQYRADFAIMAVATVITSGATLLFLSVIFGKITQLQGWSFYEVVLVYGLGSVSGAINSVFLNMPHSIAWYVLRGQLDVVLVRPARPLFQMHGERCLNPVGAGGLVVGVAIVALALARLDLAFRGWWLLYLPPVAISGAVLAFSIYLILACLNFWFTSVGSLLIVLGYVPEFARYPLAIYGRPIQFVLTWVLPYAMAGLFPAGFLLGKEGYQLYGLLAPLMGWLFLGLALLVWSAAVRRYKSTGT